MDNWPTLNGTVETVIAFCLALLRALGIALFCPRQYHQLEPSEERSKEYAGPAALAALSAVLVLVVWSIPETRLTLPVLLQNLRPDSTGAGPNAAWLIVRCLPFVLLWAALAGATAWALEIEGDDRVKARDVFLYAYTLPHLWIGLALLFTIWSGLPATKPIVYTLLALCFYGPLISLFAIRNYIHRRGWSWRAGVREVASLGVIVFLFLALILPQKIASLMAKPPVAAKQSEQKTQTNVIVAEPKPVSRLVLL